MYDKEFVIVDVETTGLSAWGGDRIIEIAALKIKNLNPISQFYSLVNPQREISWGAYQVNGISQTMVAEAPLASEVLPEFLQFLGEAHIVGHNIKFDLGFLINELALLGLSFKEDIVVLDTMHMARRVVPGLASYSLGNVARALDVKITKRHRAMADANLTFEVFHRLLTKTTATPFPINPERKS